MNEIPFPGGTNHLQREPVLVLLRGGHLLQGDIHVADGMPLINYLRIRRLFLNLTSVRRIDRETGESPHGHLSIRLSNIVWVVPLESSLELTSGFTPTDLGRVVELHLVDDKRLRVTLNMSENQRMSDYLDANTGFVPLFQAQVEPEGQVVSRMAVNHEAILAIREVPAF